MSRIQREDNRKPGRCACQQTQQGRRQEEIQSRGLARKQEGGCICCGGHRALSLGTVVHSADSMHVVPTSRKVLPSVLLREDVLCGGEEVILRGRGYLGDICPFPICFGLLA